MPLVNPFSPYSKFQAVSLPPAVQEISALLTVTLDAKILVGAIQPTQDFISNKSMAKSPFQLVPVEDLT